MIVRSGSPFGTVWYGLIEFTIEACYDLSHYHEL
jgi:hypothetical protein